MGGPGCTVNSSGCLTPEDPNGSYCGDQADCADMSSCTGGCVLQPETATACAYGPCDSSSSDEPDDGQMMSTLGEVGNMFPDWLNFHYTLPPAVCSFAAGVGAYGAFVAISGPEPVDKGIGLVGAGLGAGTYILGCI